MLGGAPASPRRAWGERNCISSTRPTAVGGLQACHLRSHAVEADHLVDPRLLGHVLHQGREAQADEEALANLRELYELFLSGNDIAEVTSPGVLTSLTAGCLVFVADAGGSRNGRAVECLSEVRAAVTPLSQR